MRKLAVWAISGLLLAHAALAQDQAGPPPGRPPASEDSALQGILEFLDRFKTLSPKEQDQVLARMHTRHMDQLLEMGGFPDVGELPKEHQMDWLTRHIWTGSTYWASEQYAIRMFRGDWADSLPETRFGQDFKLMGLRGLLSMMAQVAVEGVRCRNPKAPQAVWNNGAGFSEIWDYGATLPEVDRRAIIRELIELEGRLADLRKDDWRLCQVKGKAEFVSESERGPRQAEVRKTLSDTLGALLRLPGARSALPVPGPMVMGSPVGRIAFQTEAQSIAWSPDGDRLAVAINEGRQIALVDARSGQRLWTADARGDLIRSMLRFSADGSSIYIAADRRAEGDALADVLTIVSARDGTVVRRFRYNGATNRPQRAEALAVDEGRGRILATPNFPGDKLLAFAGMDAVPVILADWPIVLGPNTLPSRSFSPAHIAVDGPRDRLWWARAGMLRLLRLSDASLQKEIQAFETHIEALQINPRNGEVIVGGAGQSWSSSSPDGSTRDHRDDEATLVRAFDPQTGKQLRTYAGPGGYIYGLSVSPDGRHLAAARGYSFDQEDRIQSATNFSVWDAASGKLLAWRTFGEEWVHDVAFDPSGNRIAVAVDKSVQIFRIQP